MFLICLSLCGVWCFGQLDVLLQAWDIKWKLCFSLLSVAPRCPVTISMDTPKWLVSTFHWGRCERQYSSVTNCIGYRDNRGLPTSVLQNPPRKQGLQKDNWSPKTRFHPPPRSVYKNSAAFLFNGGRGERRRKTSILKFHQFSQKTFQKFTSSLQIMHALEVLLIMGLQMSRRTYFHHSIRHQKSMHIWLYLTIQFNFLQ